MQYKQQYDNKMFTYLCLHIYYLELFLRITITLICSAIHLRIREFVGGISIFYICSSTSALISRFILPLFNSTYVE